MFKIPQPLLTKNKTETEIIIKNENTSLVILIVQYILQVIIEKYFFSDFVKCNHKSSDANKDNTIPQLHVWDLPKDKRETTCRIDMIKERSKPHF